jgi:hypothetical protein
VSDDLEVDVSGEKDPTEFHRLDKEDIVLCPLCDGTDAANYVPPSVREGLGNTLGRVLVREDREASRH